MVKMATVWDRTAEFLSDNIGTVVPIALLAIFAPTSIGGNFSHAMTSAGPGLALTLTLVQLAFAVLSVWGSLAIIALATDSASAQEAGKLAARRLPVALAVSVALFAVAIVALLPLPAMLAANGYDLGAIARGTDVAFSGPMGVAVLVYLLVFAGLSLWIGARLMVWMPVLVREKRSFDALAESWSLTRGMTLRIIGVCMLYALVAWVSVLAAQMVFGVIFELVAGGGGDGVTLAGVLTSVVVAAVQTCFAVLVPAFTAKLYVALASEAGLRRGIILA